MSADEFNSKKNQKKKKLCIPTPSMGTRIINYTEAKHKTLPNVDEQFHRLVFPS